MNLKKCPDFLRADQCLNDREDLTTYAFDGTAGIRQLPALVVFPESTAEVADCIRWAREWGLNVVTRGSGTGLAGGSVPADSNDSLVLCLNRMNRILGLDVKNLTLRVEPGVITQKINEHIAPHGLFYPPDPSSQKISTIGGNVANNSGGLRGLKYGVTRDYVMALEVVLASGEIVRLGNACVKDVAGYSLKELFIGSEGTLGVVTEILLKLIPAPAAKQTLLATYDSMEAASATVSAIIAARIVPCTMEFIDRFTLQSVEAFAKLGLPTDCEAVLLIETDGHPQAVQEEAAAMTDIARAQGALQIQLARDAAHAEQLASARRSAFAAVARIRPTTILEDITVPRSRLVEMVRFVQETARQYDLKIATFGHFGDGNLHPTILTDEKDEAEMERVEQALEALFQKTLELGGTITGEHGVGLAKKKFLQKQFNDYSYELLKLVKHSVDPDNLLNPGKIFDV
ncbi:MAG: FAD-binding protein [Opitutales bacterium]|nr:FAD-binding protein [Opitutales bacterium]